MPYGSMLLIILISTGREESWQHHEHVTTQNRTWNMKIDIEDTCHQQDGLGHEGLGIDNVYGLSGESIDTTVEALYRERDKVKFTQSGTKR